MEEYKEISENDFYLSAQRKSENFSMREREYISSTHDISYLHLTICCLIFPEDLIYISKYTDEWFYVRILFSVDNIYKYYLCDQFEGVKSLLSNYEYV